MVLRSWTRPVIFAGVVVMSLVPAFLSNPRQIMLLTGLVAGAGAFLLLLKKPELGLAATLISCVLIPVGIGTGTESSFSLAMLLTIILLGLWVFDMVARQHKISLEHSDTLLPLIAFGVVIALSFGFGQIKWFSASPAPIRAQIGGLMIFLLCLGAYLLVSQQVKDERWLEILTWVFMGASGFFLIFVQLLTPYFPSLNRFVLNFYASGTGTMFWVWVVAIAVSQVLFNPNLKIRWKIALLGIVGIVFYLNYYLGREWTGGWLPPLVVIPVILFVGLKKWKIPMVLLGSLLVLLITPKLYSAVMFNNQYSYDTRLAAWTLLLQIVKVNPILGLGPANYYWYTPLFNILGFYVQFNSHNNFIDIIAQTGLLGLACYIWFFVEVWRIAWKLQKRVPEGFSRAFVYGTLGAVVGIQAAAFLGDWVLPFVYNVGFKGMRISLIGWLLLGGIVVLEKVYLSPSGKQAAVREQA